MRAKKYTAYSNKVLKVEGGQYGDDSDDVVIYQVSPTKRKCGIVNAESLRSIGTIHPGKYKQPMEVVITEQSHLFNIDLILGESTRGLFGDGYGWYGDTGQDIYYQVLQIIRQIQSEYDEM